MRKFRLYTQFEHLVPWFEEDAIKCLEGVTETDIQTELDLANAYRKFEADRVARGGNVSPFRILDPPSDKGGRRFH